MKYFFLWLSLLSLPALPCLAQAPVNGDRAAAAADSNEFGLILYQYLCGGTGNLFFSPAGIATTLAMVYAGAAGDTAQAMEKTLHFSLGPQRLHPAMAALLAGLDRRKMAGGYELSLANAIWIQNGFPLRDDYSALVKNLYGAGLGELDFATRSLAANGIINGWVSEMTDHKIPDLAPPGSITAATRMAVIDAIYFKDQWKDGFAGEQTRDGPFTGAGARSSAIPFMHKQGRYPYMKGATFQALEIPYRNSEVSMIVLLPNSPGGLSDFERSLTGPHLAKWLDELKPAGKIDLALPKFSLSQPLALADALKAMGMGVAFDGSMADFSGISAQKGLFLSAVLHKAYIKVDEEGTEAAAATAGLTTPTAAALRDQTALPFHADHPFVFLIRENFSGAILFIGRVSDPSA